MSQFFCAHLTCEEFDIKEWNVAYKYCLDNNLSEAETNAILHPPACEKQCFNCMAIVGERQLKTKQHL
jgi:hypothetical protein